MIDEDNFYNIIKYYIEENKDKPEVIKVLKKLNEDINNEVNPVAIYPKCKENPSL
jgi:hypothetical protein